MNAGRGLALLECCAVLPSTIAFMLSRPARRVYIGQLGATEGCCAWGPMPSAAPYVHCFDVLHQARHGFAQPCIRHVAEDSIATAAPFCQLGARRHTGVYTRYQATLGPPMRAGRVSKTVFCVLLASPALCLACVPLRPMAWNSSGQHTISLLHLGQKEHHCFKDRILWVQGGALCDACTLLCPPSSASEA